MYCFSSSSWFRRWSTLLQTNKISKLDSNARPFDLIVWTTDIKGEWIDEQRTNQCFWQPKKWRKKGQRRAKGHRKGIYGLNVNDFL